jgi:tRNA A-37 threonylcarbamoyl transferase component Bud32/predicted nucleotidyltransferase
LRRLEEKEIFAIQRTISKLNRAEKIASLCVYGSQIAGYSKPESDYDVLLVLNNYKPRVRYRYLKGEVPLSVLVVDAQSLESDAQRASLGEFVVGRLLNVYEPIVGSQFLKKTEITYKQRSVFEALADIVTSYGGFASVLRIPIEYFLFQKLHTRASIYPPAFYSYAKHYSGPERNSNLAWAKAGFRAACRYFEKQHILSLEGDYVFIRPGKIKSGRLQKVGRIASLAARTIAQYTVHGYAGRVGLGVVGREVLSKISRTRDDKSQVPEELRHPKRLWRLEGSNLFVDSNNWMLDLVETVGLKKEATFRQISPNEVYSTSSVYEFENNGKTQRFVVKKFRDLKSMKWAFLGLWALPSIRFNMTPLARMFREFQALVALRRAGVLTPDVVALFLNDRILVTKFVEGKDLGQILNSLLSKKSENFQPFEEYGECLAKVHRFGYALGDTKPSNAILTDSGLVLTDLEQAVAGGDQAWDVAEFLYYASKFTLKADAAKLVAQYFCAGYLRGGQPSVVKKAMGLKYQAPFRPFITMGVHRAVQQELQDAIIAHA